MNAGPEMDALVAEKVMGWKAKHREDKCNGVIITKCGACGRAGHGNCYGQFGGGEIQLTCEESPCCEAAQLPDYSTSIADAWLVVEEMVKRGKVFIVKGDGLRTGDHNPKWTVLCDNQPRVDANVAPLAICLAALQAVGYTMEVPQ